MIARDRRQRWRPRPAGSRAHRRLARHRRRTHRGDRARAGRSGRAPRSSTPRDCYVVPGFIDVHVHGVDGHDTLDGDGAVAHIAASLPRYGVTAFCPTTVACPPRAICAAFLQQVARHGSPPLPDPHACCPHISRATSSTPSTAARSRRQCLRTPAARAGDGDYSGRDILDVISACPPGRRHRDARA